MIKFNLDKKVKLSYYEQLKGQLISAVYCGKIQEGDKLPSIRELSGQFDVNYKTIRKIFKKLADEGFLEIIKVLAAFLNEGGIMQAFVHYHPRHPHEQGYICAWPVP